MSAYDILIIVVASFAAATINGIAGGGTFVTFFALVETGLAPVSANATSAMILTPANFSSTLAYLPEIRRHARRYWPLALASIMGGVLGAILLRMTPGSSFQSLVPFFLGLATFLFAVSPSLSRLINQMAAGPGSAGRRRVGVVMQFMVSIYGGYFGAGMGIMMLAALALAEGNDYHFINAAKNLCALLIQLFALMTLLSAGLISWPHALVGVIASTLGGYIGVRLARRVPTSFVRWLVVLIGGLLTLRYALT